MTQLYDTLEKLSNAMGVSGDEREVRALIMERLKNRADVTDITTDAMGNLTAIRKGTGAIPLRVMISAHMDEPGFMVIEVSDDGLIHVVNVGGHDHRLIPTQRVLVGDAKTPGVFLWKPIHQSREQNVIEPKDMAIDVGADSKDAVKAGPGERVAFAGTYTALSERVVRGKAFDSRAGCALLLELLDGDPLPFDLALAFTAQAQIGGRGAGVAAHRLDPQLAITLGGVTCNDLPGDPEEDRTALIRLGGGPVLVGQDADFIADRLLIGHLRQTARMQTIPVQFDAQARRPAATAAISFARTGVPTLTVALPIRYLGSPNALLRLDDLDHTLALLRAALPTLTSQVLETSL